MTTDNDVLQRAQTPPPPHVRAPRLAPPPDPMAAVVFWPAVASAGIAGNFALRVGHNTLAGFIAVAALIAVTASQRSGRMRTIDHAALGLAFALSIVLTLRTSHWVTVPAMIAAAGLTFSVGTNQLTSHHQPWITGLRNGILSSVASARWAVSVVDRVGRGVGHPAVAVFRSAVVAGSLGLLLVALLASGDSVSASLLSNAQAGPTVGHTVTIAVGALGAIIVGFISYLSPEEIEGPRSRIGRFQLEAKAVLGTIVAVLGAWCAVQVSVALGAADQILQTEGLTVAEYAREGFFQLVAVAAIVLIAVRLAASVSGLPSQARGRSFRLASTVIGAELLLLIGASFLRLGYYISEFGLTMLRLSVAWFLAWLSVFSVVVIARATGSAWAERWSHTTLVLSLGITVLAFSAANPEAIVVNTNLKMVEVDSNYLLTGLSGDGLNAIRSSERPAAEDLSASLCVNPVVPSYGIASWNFGNLSC